jgi:phospholipase/carboxylesterase
MEFIEAQMSVGIPSHRILLAGFSQGGVIALHTALRYPARLAGVMALSTYLHDPQGCEAALNDANLAIPVFMAHGQGDPMIPIMRAATARENLIRLACDVEWRDYPMGHQVCMEEIEDISAFIRRVL